MFFKISIKEGHNCCYHSIRLEFKQKYIKEKVIFPIVSEFSWDVEELMLLKNLFRRDRVYFLRSPQKEFIFLTTQSLRKKTGEL